MFLFYKIVSLFNVLQKEFYTMLLKKITYLIFALLPLLSVAQKKDTAPLDLEDYILVKIGDTLTINLDELTILPKPTTDYKLWFEYQVVKDRTEGSTIITPNVVSDYSNIGYDFANYNKINDVGRQWIRKYTLALAKEMLGAIREKYNTVPIPGSEVSLDGAALRAEAQTEKDALIEQLRENLNEVSKKQRMENESNMVEQQQQIMNRVPLNIYIG